MINDEVARLFQELVEISLLWDKVGVVRSRVEAPWAPTPMNVAEFVMSIASIGVGDVVYDLGCGDGRIVIEAAKRSAKAVCVEVDPKLIEVSRKMSRIAGVEDRILFINDDVSNVDLSQATAIYMYLTTNVINKLKNKFLKELTPGTLIISLDYEVNWLTPIDIIEINNDRKQHKVFLYLTT